MGQEKLSFTAGRLAILKNSLAVSYKSDHILINDPVIVFFGIYPNNLKFCVNKQFAPRYL